MEENLEVAKHVPRERVPNYTVEHLVDVTAPRIRRGTGRVIQSTPQDRISGYVIEQIVDVAVPEVREKTGQVTKECVRQHTDKQLVFGGNAEHIEKPIASGMLGNAEASKIQGQQQHRSQPQRGA